MSNLFLQNELQNLILEAVNVCKEKQYYDLKNRLNQSFCELLEAEAHCRRTKVNSIILSIQKFEKTLRLLEYEYEKVTSITKIPAIEEYITHAERCKKSLLQDKKRLERSSRKEGV